MRAVERSNEGKVFFPDAGITKGQLIDYYDRVADTILPHLRGRPLALQRFPDGIDAEGFHQKQASPHFPAWITRARVRLRSGAQQELVVCDDRDTLVYLANQACIVLHPWLSRADLPDRPDQLLFDLDPPSRAFEPVRSAALRVRGLLEELALPAFAKLTGSKGVHVMVPLDRSADFDAARAFARDAMGLLARRHPDELTLEQRIAKRGKRVYLDTTRNAFGQTAVAPYSVRALPGAPVAAPISWAQLERGGLDARRYDVRNLFRSLGQRRDPWRGWARQARSLGAARERLDRLLAR